MSEIGSSGSFVETGNRVLLVGGASGIDTSALVEAAVNQRLREANTIDFKIAENDLRSTAYSTLQNLGSELQSSLTALRGAFGLSSTDGAIFDARAGTLTSNNSVDPSSLVNVTIDENAQVGTNSLVIRRTAREEINASDRYADPNAALNLNGDFRLRLAGLDNVDINIVASDSLNDVASKINAVAEQTGVSASVIQVTETRFELVVRGTETGLNMQNTVGAGDNILQSLGIIDGGGAYQNQVQNDRNALIDFNGVRISRDSNTIEDLVPGVDIDIVGQDTGTTLTLDIGNDNAGVKAAIEGFVESYNAFREFVIQNNQVAADGTVSDDAPLFNDSLMDGLDRAVQGLFGNNYTSSNDFSSLGELGIELNSSNQLEIDNTILDDAIINNFEGLRGLFQTQYSDDNDEFNIIENESTLGDLSFTLDIVHGGSNIISVSVGGDSTLFDINGTVISGKEGTIYEGLSFAYVGNTGASINIDLRQGFADLGVNTLEGYVNSASGLIQQEKLAIDDQNEDLTTRADRVRERAEAYRESLIQQYASFEAQLNRANAVLDQIRAILGTNDDE